MAGRKQLNVRFTDEQEREFQALSDAASARAGVELTQAQVFALALAALRRELLPEGKGVKEKK